MKLFKLTLFTLIVATPSFLNAQVPFEKDGKWGVSKNGSDTDSIIFRADYDEIMSLDNAGPKLFIGKRGEEWQMLTSNVLVNQQRYDEVILASPFEGHALGIREGYFDMVDIEKADFVIRGVKADGIADVADLETGVNEFALTSRGKGFYGILNVKTKKELLKTEFTSIKRLEKPVKDIEFIAYKDGQNFAYNKTGKLLYTLDVEGVITKVEGSDDMPTGIILKVETKKDELIGYYDTKSKWLIPVAYTAIESLERGSDVVAITNAKGLKGLYFLGKQLLECEYLDVETSDKDSFVAFVVSKKGKQYVSPQGKLSALE